jgi:DNA invertase Pin-like site-specific DNA recombinase
MFIRAYLRVSTEDQFADREKEMLVQFVQEWGHKIASYYREILSCENNATSGSCRFRP